MSKRIITADRRIITPSRRDFLTGGLATATLVGCGAGDTAGQSGYIEGGLCAAEEAQRAELMAGTGSVFDGIKHIVVVCMENRSFDHMFGALSIEPGLSDDFGNDYGGEGRSDVNGLSGYESNRDRDGNAHRVFRQTIGSGPETELLGDIAHAWENCQNQVDLFSLGEMDGFVAEHQRELEENGGASCKGPYFGREGCAPYAAAMGIYNRQDLPIYYALADNYAICDNYFCSVRGPTWPNRFFLNLGSAYGQKENKPVLGKSSIFEVMRDKHLTVENLFCDLPWSYVAGEGGALFGAKFCDGDFGGILAPFYGGKTEDAAVIPQQLPPSWQPYEQSLKDKLFEWGRAKITDREDGYFGSFLDRVKNDKLGAFTLIDPPFSAGFDDHPPCRVHDGQAFISYIYAALRSNPKVWQKTLLIITYDEHGSFYDHQRPPEAQDGGKKNPHYYDANPEFRQLGMRVPTILVGPRVKPGYVSHELYDHLSILRTLYDRFALDEDMSKDHAAQWYENKRLQETATFADCILPDEDGLNMGPDLPQLEYSESQMMDFAARFDHEGQPELSRLADDGVLPAHLDHRKHRVAQMEQFLREGEELGAFRITR